MRGCPELRVIVNCSLAGAQVDAAAAAAQDVLSVASPTKMAKHKRLFMISADGGGGDTDTDAGPEEDAEKGEVNAAGAALLMDAAAGAAEVRSSADALLHGINLFIQEGGCSHLRWWMKSQRTMAAPVFQLLTCTLCRSQVGCIRTHHG